MLGSVGILGLPLLLDCFFLPVVLDDGKNGGGGEEVPKLSTGRRLMSFKAGTTLGDQRGSDSGSPGASYAQVQLTGSHH